MIGTILRVMRLAKGLKQTELATKIGVVQTTLSGWERGYRQPKFDDIVAIAQECGYTISFYSDTDEIKVRNKEEE